MEYNFVYINPICIQSGKVFEIDGPTYLGQFVASTMAANGVCNYHFPLGKPFQTRSLTRALGQISLKILECLRGDRLNVVGITHWTTNSWLAKALMNILRMQSKDLKIPVMIIGGGPFFAREQLLKNGNAYPDSIEAALVLSTPEWGLPTYDAVILGGFTALLETLKGIEHDEITFDKDQLFLNTPPAGYYYRRGSQIEGSGRSRNAPIIKAPVASFLRKESYDAAVMFSNNCPNGCDYCSTGQSHRFSRDQVREAIKEFRENLERMASSDYLRRIRYLRLLDPNPFTDSSRQHTCDCLEAVYSELGFRPALHCFYDSYGFRDPGKVLADMRDVNLRRMAVGREAACEPGLSFMGRKHLGKPRTLEVLKEERTGLDEVIRRQKEDGKEFRLLLDYILTPADTRNSLNETLEDMRHFRDESSGKVQVRTHWEPLWPNSGTAVLKRSVHLLSDDPYFTSSNADVWNMNNIEQEYPLSVFREVVAGIADV